ncbi:MAG: Rrf2 family transcriptional regulator [Gammaproteobacteria bacterium]|nr:Rrf2 family transcriptional regulator [Gammaproteobacteria bacterium]
MQLTTHTDYSLRLLIYLALLDKKQTGTVQLAADHYGISANHLAKVAQTLVQLGYVHSLRGRGGGLKLALSADEINLGDIVRKTENLQLLECFGEQSSCPIIPACNLKRVLASAQTAFLEILDDYNLADLVTNRKQLIKLLQVA